MYSLFCRFDGSLTLCGVLHRSNTPFPFQIIIKALSALRLLCHSERQSLPLITEGTKKQSYSPPLLKAGAMADFRFEYAKDFLSLRSSPMIQITGRSMIPVMYYLTYGDICFLHGLQSI